jgi:hypothetical protein
MTEAIRWRTGTAHHVTRPTAFTARYLLLLLSFPATGTAMFFDISIEINVIAAPKSSGWSLCACILMFVYWVK